MKRLLLRLLPDETRRGLRRKRRQLKTQAEFWRDGRRYQRFSHWLEIDRPRVLQGRHLEAQLTKDYHRVEKGLALRGPRRPFGVELQERLAQHLPQSSPSDDYAGFAQDALDGLRGWNDLGTRGAPLVLRHDELPAWEISRDQVTAFFESRRSVRDFSATVPTRAILEEATSLAANTPSVCNRQASHVYFVSGPDVKHVLEHQNGNAGFRHLVPVAGIITADLRLFGGPGERNQAWVDGGLFAMTLVWAFHALGLDSCLLNWSMTNSESDALRKAVGIPDHEIIITMFAVGYANEGARVARSPRRAVDSLATFRQSAPAESE